MLLGPNFLWPRPLHHEKRVWRYLWEESPASASRNPWVCWTFSRRSPSRASSVCPNVGPNWCGFNVSSAAFLGDDLTFEQTGNDVDSIGHTVALGLGVDAEHHRVRGQEAGTEAEHEVKFVIWFSSCGKVPMGWTRPCW